MLLLNHGEKEKEEIATTQAEVCDNGKPPTSTAVSSSSSSSSKVDTTRGSGGNGGFVCNDIADLVRRRGHEINARIQTNRDMDELSYFGFKTLERSYLLKVNESTIVERPQYMWMRVALGIHCCKPRVSDSDGGEDARYDSKSKESSSLLSSKESMNYNNDEEDANLNAAFETYDLMSQGYFTHASPTLFHAGTIHPQLCSCFLLKMSDDSINGIYDTLKHCALISKVSLLWCKTLEREICCCLFLMHNI
jgi:hypothetical protein